MVWLIVWTRYLNMHVIKFKKKSTLLPRQTASCTDPIGYTPTWHFSGPSVPPKTGTTHHFSDTNPLHTSPWSLCDYHLCLMWNSAVGGHRWVGTLVESELFMYGSAQWLIPPWSTFSMRATRKMSGWGHVTENTPWGEITHKVRRRSKNLISLISAPYQLACLGYFKTASGTPWKNLGPSGWASPPPFMYWLVWLGTMALTDGWFKSTWKSEEIFLPFWMSNSDSVT